MMRSNVLVAWIFRLRVTFLPYPCPPGRRIVSSSHSNLADHRIDRQSLTTLHIEGTHCWNTKSVLNYEAQSGQEFRRAALTAVKEYSSQ